MISINVNTNGTRRTISQDITSTPNEAFREVGIDASTSSVNIDGQIINRFNNDSLSKTFEQLGVQDGTTISLGAVVKGDGANA